MLIEQHFHGAFGINFSDCSVDDVLLVAKKMKEHGVDGIYPTLVTDTVENVKRQIRVIKEAARLQTEDCAEIMGIHLEGIFLNPEKRGIQDADLFLEPNVENYKLLEDDFIKIVTLAPELDKGLIEYLRGKGVRVQAGHCVGGDLSGCDGATHLFNGMKGIVHRGKSTALSALLDDEMYVEVIADGVHLSDDILKLIFKMKPKDKVVLISDCLPCAGVGKPHSFEFAGETIYYDGEKATSKDGTIAGSAMLLPEIVERVRQLGLID